MKRKLITLLALIALVLLTLDFGTRAVGSLGSGVSPAEASGLSTRAIAPPASQPMGSAFTYQGKLLDNGQPVSGQYDFTFKLFDQATGGAQIGSTNTANGQPVSAGLFTVYLDFGSTAFTGDARWLETAVRPTGGGNFTTLSPRQAITPTPYAVYAQSALNAQSVPWPGVGGKPAPYNPVRLPNVFATLDSARDVGQYASATIGADGLPLVAYYDATNEYLKVAHCTDLACTGRTVSTVDDRGRVGRYASVAIGTDGLPLISYYDAANQSLRVAHCDDRACSNALITTLDQARGGRFGAITIGSDGLGLIAYFSEPPAAAAVAHCQNQACSKASITVLPRPNYWDGIDQTMAVAVGIDGLPLIAFSSYHIEIDGTSVRGWVALCKDVTCSTASLRSFDQWPRGPRAVGESQPMSLAIGPDGLGLIAYSRGGGGGVGGYSALYVAHCALPDCSAWDLAQIKPGFRESYPYDTGLYPSISVRPGGLPSISFYDYGGSNPRLQLASCLDPLCDSGGPFTRPGISTFDGGADVGQFGSITVGVDGLPLISYYDATNGDLKVLHCGSPQCVSYQRQR